MSSVRPVSPFAALRASLAMLGQRPLTLLALGAAVVLSLMSVCCGLGFITAPWFMCELFVVLLGAHRGGRAPLGQAGPGRLRAMLVMLVAVVLVSAVGVLALLGASVGGVKSPAAGPPALVEMQQILHTGGFYAVLASLATLVLVLPYLYTPLLLLERRGGLFGAALESARMVFAGGVLSRLALSGLAHALIVMPMVVAAGLGYFLAGEGGVPRWVLFSLPLLSVTVPLGQGMVVASYLETVDSVRGLSAVPEGFRLPRGLGALWSLLLSVPLLVAVLVCLSLTRPVGLAAGPVEGVVVEDVAVSEGERAVYPPATGLTLQVSPERVAVVASDGGGAGSLPVRGSQSINRLRLVRAGEAYGIEVHQGQRVSHTWIDRAGVRVDDGLKRRLLARFPKPILVGLLAALFLTGLVSAPVLTGLGRVRRAHQMPARNDHASDALAVVRRRMFARAWLAGAALLPFALAALYTVARVFF